MAGNTIFDVGTKILGKGLHLVQYGYAESPEVTLLLYDVKTLNTDTLDFRAMSLKGVANKVSITPTGESVEWDEEDYKEAPAVVSVATSSTTLTVNMTNMSVGENLYNQRTQESALVVGVAGSVITLLAPGFTAPQVNDNLMRVSFSKQYGVNNYHVSSRNDLIPNTNYIQFTEEGIESDMITNNKTLLFLSQEEKDKAKFSDASRKIIKGVAAGFYVGKQTKTNTSGNYQYTAGGLNDYIPSSAVVNVKTGTSDNEGIKNNLRVQIQKAYQSGLSGLFGKNKILWFCTTTFANAVHALYDEQIRYNDELTSIEMNIKTYDVGGYMMSMVPSNLLDYLLGDIAVAYVVPIDYTMLYMLPRAALSENGKTAQLVGRGIVYKKPQVTIESSTIALATNYSYVFQGITSGAYRKITIA